LDALYWKPGWVAPPPDEWDALLGRIVASERWIVDGNFTASLPRRLDRADTIVFLDLPRRNSMVGVVRRRIKQAWRLPPGVAEGSRPMFNLQLVRWIWTFPEDHRPEFVRLLASQPPDKRVAILRRRGEVGAFLAEIERLR
jgi:adenylate kinase family enzyme